MADASAPMCGGDSENDSLVSPGAWFVIEGSGVELRTFTCRGSSFSGFDTLITVYEGTSCNTLKCVGVDNNACGTQSIFAWGGKVGVQYYVVVSSGSGAADETGDYRLDLLSGQEFTDEPSRAPATVPDNDTCEAAIPLDSTTTAQTVIGSTAGATFDGAILCGTGNTGPGVWYSFMGDGNVVTIDTCDEVATKYDTKLSVYNGNSCNDLQCVGGNDDACGASSRFSWPTDDGEMYWILVHGFGLDVGDFELSISPSNSATNDSDEQPTTAPSTTAPTPEENQLCFSGDSLVETHDGRVIKMESLKIGDVVKVGEKEFSEVYSFGHIEKHIWAEFLQISTDQFSSIKISTDHLIFISKKGAIPASALSIGDELVMINPGERNDKVTSIKAIKSKGLYAPFTKSGKILVNGILSSNFVTLTGESSFSLGGVVCDMHWLSYLFLAPRRIAYFHLGFKEEIYTQEGHSKWISGLLSWARWILIEKANNAVVQTFVLIPAVLTVAVCDLVERCLSLLLTFTPTAIIVKLIIALCVGVAAGKSVIFVSKKPSHPKIDCSS